MRTVFDGKVIKVTVEQVELPNGASARFEIIHHPGGAAVVALDAGQRVCLLRQYRHALRDWLWEIPAGKLDPGETPLGTAQRELADEAGLNAARWRPLGDFVSSPGVFTETVHLYLATGLSTVDARPEAEEVFELHWLDLEQAMTLARSGEIRDGKSVVALYRAAALAAGT